MYKHVMSFLALATLSACAGAPMIAPQEILSSYQPSELAASAGKAPIGVTVRGRPFGLDDQAAAARLVAMLPTSTPAATRLNAATGPADSPVHHLVFSFAAPLNETADALCRGGRTGSVAASTGDRITIFAALCIGVSPQTWAVGTVDQATSIDAPAVRALIAQLGSRLMPNDNPGNKSDGGVRVVN
jgi:hypothetical protein